MSVICLDSSVWPGRARDDVPSGRAVFACEIRRATNSRLCAKRAVSRIAVMEPFRDRRNGPPDDRRVGASTGSAQRRHSVIGVMEPPVARASCVGRPKDICKCNERIACINDARQHCRPSVSALQAAGRRRQYVELVSAYQACSKAEVPSSENIRTRLPHKVTAMSTVSLLWSCVSIYALQSGPQTNIAAHIG